QTVVLADSYSDETGKREPVVWLNEHDGVKVFGISLGHHNETIEAESWQLMVSQGLRWAVHE
ncbi:MAG: ThuA domain-containing protein, partial [Planctomycetota bacterium]|nr:ThuA domain-containing protein [Planctomycetota bacterium]